MGNGRVRTAGEHLGCAQAGQPVPTAGKLAQHEAGAVPRHVRMIPLNPGQAVASGVPSGLHVEVGAGCENLRPKAPGPIDDGQRIAVFVAVDVREMTPGWRWRGRRGIAKLGRDGLGGAAGQRLAVEATAVLGEVRVAAGYGKVAPAVADLRAHRERGVVVARGRARLLADEHALRSSALQPDEGATIGIPSHVAEARGMG